ncbi:MAG: hypothetical protein A3E74_07595 [Omnitrophica bacterium RIFCSPHIGHO2_12_FULL_44_12]|nr:MAG: hypothetical protein A3E74_07595 [Omnitrophica bacterium RIFCSPHIGHO2_12_FULL_44_12]OGX02908.1 MAG: hypothetical protein A3J12_05135 [Omnitrophica bacterium RIFCSPLOWO2_02_FULL_44_11]
MTHQKIFSTPCSEDKDVLKAIHMLADQVIQDFKGASCDLAVLFVSAVYLEVDHQKIWSILRAKLSVNCLLACNAYGVVGHKSEYESKPAVSLMAMHLPGVKVLPFSFFPEDVDTISSGKELLASLDLYPTDKPHFLCLAEPMTCDSGKFVELLNEGYPCSPVIGGMASANVLGFENWLMLNGEVYESGVVGVVLCGDIEFETIVSQGCRPVGEPYAITKVDRNILYELGSQPALKVLQEMYDKLPEGDRNLAKDSLFVGLAMDERKVNFQRGDFLIRNIVGADQERNALAIGAILKAGQTVQFQLRDADSSKEDLRLSLGKSVKERNYQIKKKNRGLPEAIFLVNCCGRGLGLFGKPDHDVKMIQSMRGPLPLAGFFANGEFGPVGPKNYVHGYSLSLTIIR